MGEVSSPSASVGSKPESQSAGGSSRSGPGWLLSAYTLGSGTAVGSLWAGATFGYDLLWVQPLAMLMGVIILSGAAYFTLQSDVSPYERFKRELCPAMALAWALTSLFASVIWHLPQYGLAFAALQGLVGFQETTLTRVLVGGAILAVSTAITWSYSRRGGVLIYEGMMKVLVWMTIICVALVIIASRVPWGEVARGFTSFRRPEGSTIVIFGLLGAAVGINMTFLYPYSIRSKGWRKTDTPFAVRDLVTGMFVPYVLATGMMVIASTVTLHASGVLLNKGRITEMAGVFEPVFGSQIGPMLFNIGILAMPLGTITLHMLTCGFILSEMMGRKERDWIWRLGTLIPAIGVLGVAYPLKGWLPVTASAICLIFLPIAYIGFVVLFWKEARKPDAIRVPARQPVVALMVGVVAVISTLAVVKAVSAVKELAQYF